MMNYENIYDVKKRYLEIISKLKNIHQNIYYIIKHDQILFTKNQGKVYFDLENVPNHTWLKIKENVDKYIFNQNLEKKTNYSI